MLTLSGSSSLLPRLNNRRSALSFALNKRSLVMRAQTRDIIDISLEVAADSRKHSFPILVNGCTGKMGQAVAEAAVSAGLELVPVSFSSVDKPARTLEIGDIEIRVHGPSEREEVLSSVTEKYPDVVVVDYTVPNAVNANAELYCKFKVPFVMGTTGGDRQLLYKTVQDSNVYSVISPQMGKQGVPSPFGGVNRVNKTFLYINISVGGISPPTFKKYNKRQLVVAFLAAMEIMAEQFPGAFAGYKLEVMESHQATKLDTSGTAKAVIACFQKLGAIFDMNEIKMIRDPEEQINMVGVPKEHLAGHAYHVYNLTSPDDTVFFEFQHNVCGRSIYAEGSIDAAIFLHKKVQSKAEKKIYDMIDVLREGNMR